MPFMYPAHNHSDLAAASGHGPVEHKILTAIKYASYVAAGLSLLPFAARLVDGPLSNSAASLEWAVERCSSVVGATGLAGSLSGFLAPLPVIGATLAAGGMGAVAIAAAVGIGGTLLGRYLEKKDVRLDGIPVGKVIRWAALATSMLFAMPAILSGISMGLHFLSSFASLEFGWSGGQLGLSSLANTIGSQGSTAIAGAYGALGLAAMHGIVCGLPALISGKLSHTEHPQPFVKTDGLLPIGKIQDFGLMRPMRAA